VNPVFKLFNVTYEKFDLIYHKFLKLCLDIKILPFFMMFLMLFFTYSLYTKLKKELLPRTVSNNFEISAKTNSGYGFEETDRIAKALEDRIRKIEGVKHVFSQVGAVSSFSMGKEELSLNNIHMIVNTTGNRDRVMTVVRGLLKQFGDIKFSVYPERSTLSEYLRFGAEEFQVQLFYDSITSGKKGVAELMKRLKGVKGLVDLRSNIEKGSPVLAIDFNEACTSTTSPLLTPSLRRSLRPLVLFELFIIILYLK